MSDPKWKLKAAFDVERDHNPFTIVDGEREHLKDDQSDSVVVEERAEKVYLDIDFLSVPVPIDVEVYRNRKRVHTGTHEVQSKGEYVYVNARETKRGHEVRSGTAPRAPVSVKPIGGNNP